MSNRKLTSRLRNAIKKGFDAQPLNHTMVTISEKQMNALRNDPRAKYDQLCVKRGRLLYAGKSLKEVDALYPLPRSPYLRSGK